MPEYEASVLCWDSCVDTLFPDKYASSYLVLLLPNWLHSALAQVEQSFCSPTILSHSPVLSLFPLERAIFLEIDSNAMHLNFASVVL